MSLQSGTTLGVYSVTAKIGEGGMGEVYQARDTTLDRDVALKALPEAFTSDPYGSLGQMPLRHRQTTWWIRSIASTISIRPTRETAVRTFVLTKPISTTTQPKDSTSLLRNCCAVMAIVSRDFARALRQTRSRLAVE